ncbi:hypothetical protein AAE478_005798 [Parahypoxylon ruwenzoriense]
MLFRLNPSLLLMIPAVCANTEKAIFLGPETVNIPSAHPTLEDLHVDTLTPTDWAIRTHLDAQFPNISSPHGKATWLILDELTEGQRYEVRAVFETPELMSELSEYSWSRQFDKDGDYASQPRSARSGQASNSEREASMLFLQILAAADYYTTNKALMRGVPPVYVDIILDPFLFNILPRSLLPTVCYITLVAVASWFAAQYISIRIRKVAAEPTHEKKVQ